MSVTLSQDSLETTCNPNVLNYALTTNNIADPLSSEFYTTNLYGRGSMMTDLYAPSSHSGVELGGYEEAISLVRSASPDPNNVINNSYGTALSIPVHSYTDSYRDWVNGSDNDYYKFNLNATSVVSLKLDELSGNADVVLQNSSGFTVASSKNVGYTNEAIVQRLSPGTYYIQVSADPNSSSTTFYNLSVSAAPAKLPLPSNGGTPSNTATSTNSPTAASVTTFQTLSDGTRYYKGGLGADTFTYTSAPNSKITVFSGNGNADFGSGQRDLLDLSSIVSTTVTIDYANTSNQGVLYNVGNGTRVFDAIKFNDGRQILFEGIDRIVFANKVENLSVEPNDPLFNQQWNLHMMGVQNAWRFTTGNSNALVGIEDSGLALVNGTTHPDLGLTSYIANNYVDEMSGANATSHGLSTQSVINARTNNGIGGSGIGTNLETYQIDVLGGDANDLSLVDATSAMIQKAKAESRNLVINFSITGGYSLQLEELVAKNPNVLFVFASGNTDVLNLTELAALSKYSNAMTIGASSGRKDAYGNLKNLGDRINYPNWWTSTGGDGLTLVAPSEVIAANSSGLQFGYNYSFNGTSAAAPHATGVAGLLWSVNKNLSASDIKTILSQTAYDLGTPGYDKYYGHGFVNADAAVRRAMGIARGA